MNEEFARLSQRERDVVLLLCSGMSNVEIANSLGLAEKTVKYFLSLVYKKTQCKSSRQLMCKFYNNELKVKS